MIEFVVVSHPCQPASAELKHLAHSHAARFAHARARRLAVKKYRERMRVSSKGINCSMELGQIEDSHPVHTAFGPSMPAVVSGAFEHEPLNSFLKSLTPSEHGLYHHYITVVFPCIKTRCPTLEHLCSQAQELRDKWLLLSSTDAYLLGGFLLSACRHLSMLYPDAGYEEVAQQYKLRYIRALQQMLSTEDGLVSITAATVSMVLVLDDALIGELPTAAQHAAGAVRIAQLAGGFESMEIIGMFVRSTLLSCIYSKGLRGWSPQLADPDTLRTLGIQVHNSEDSSKAS